MSCVPNKGAMSFVYPSKLQDVYRQEKSYNLHQQRLYDIGKSKKKKNIRKTLKSQDNIHSKQMEFMERGKQFQEINKFNSIKQENKKILSKIVDIQKKSLYSTFYGPTQNNPLGNQGVNKFYQKNWNSKIGQENQKMAQRLLLQKPIITTNKFVQDYQSLDPVKMRWQKFSKQQKYLEIVSQDPNMDRFKKTRSQSYQLDPIHKTMSPYKAQISKKNFNSSQKQQTRTSLQTPDNQFQQKRVYSSIKSINKNSSLINNLDNNQDENFNDDNDNNNNHINDNYNPKSTVNNANNDSISKINYYNVQRGASSQQAQRNQKFSLYMSQNSSQEKGEINNINGNTNRSQNESNIQEISYIGNNNKNDKNGDEVNNIDTNNASIANSERKIQNDDKNVDKQDDVYKSQQQSQQPQKSIFSQKSASKPKN